MALPHRFPFRLVESTSSGVRLRLSANAFWSRGAQPLGAAWLVEATAQAAALLPRPGGGLGEQLYLAGVDGCRLERLPRAGETLEFELRHESRLGKLVRIGAIVRCDGQPLGELTLTLAAVS